MILMSRRIIFWALRAVVRDHLAYRVKRKKSNKIELVKKSKLDQKARNEWLLKCQLRKDRKDCAISLKVLL